MEEALTQKAKEVIEEIPYITIASVTPDGYPWNSPVFAAYDSEYNFFWNSSSQSQHSQNINANGRVFLVIYKSTVGEGNGFGVYFEGEAKELIAGEELEHALQVFYAKKGKQPPSQTEFLALGTQRLYKAVLRKCWVNAYDKSRTPADWKMEIKLK